MADTRPVIVIPTRNRSELAQNAIQSVLTQSRETAHVLVSDNSTAAEERASLRAFCVGLKNPSLRYVTTPEPLSMTAHWQWAIERALGDYGGKHFIYLTDRMMFKRGALGDVLRIAATYPDRVISYSHDRIVDSETPIRIERTPCTGRLLEVDTSRLIHLYAKARLHVAFPRMLNCVVPRSILDGVRSRFGNVFASAAPDFNFCCRVLDSEQKIVFYDSSPIFHYAMNRSNGASFTRGESTSDRADYFANLTSDDLKTAKFDVVTSFATVGSTVFHEYAKFKEETQSPRFEPLDERECLQVMGKELEQMTNLDAREQLRVRLIERGWKPSSPRTPPRQASAGLLRKLISPSTVARKLRWILVGPASTPAWLLASRHLRIPVPSDARLEFRSLSQAVQVVDEWPGRRVATLAWQDEMLRPTLLPGV